MIAIKIELLLPACRYDLVRMVIACRELYEIVDMHPPVAYVIRLFNHEVDMRLTLDILKLLGMSSAFRAIYIFLPFVSVLGDCDDRHQIEREELKITQSINVSQNRRACYIPGRDEQCVYRCGIPSSVMRPGRERIWYRLKYGIVRE